MVASWEVREGPVLSVLAGMADRSVSVAITSPPYYGLRAYDGDQVVDWPAVEFYPMPGLQSYMAPITIPAGPAALGGESDPLAYIGHLVAVFREVRRVLRGDGLLWLNLGDSFAGSWGNYGGRNRGAGTQRPIVNGSQIDQRAYTDLDSWRPPTAGKMAGLKPKDLIGIPSRAALALQADGWYWRSSIPWVKRNGMPDSAGDRPGSAVEWVQLLAVGRRPFYDWAAVELPAAEYSAFKKAGDKIFTDTYHGDTRPAGLHPTGADNGTRRRRNSDWWFDSIRRADSAGPTGAVPGPDGEIIGLDCAVASFPGAHFATWPPALVEPMILASTSARGCCPACGAPWRRVVERSPMVVRPSENGQAKHDQGLRTSPSGTMVKPPQSETIDWRPSCSCSAGVGDFADDDFEIIATPTGDRGAGDPSMEIGRRGLGRPRGENEESRPITRYEQRCYAERIKNSPHYEKMRAAAGSAFDHYVRTDRSGARPVPADLLENWIAAGWIDRVNLPEFTPPAPVPAIVLDPFSGSGTTGAVALSLGRRYIGIELSSEYAAMSRERIGGAQPALFGL